MIPNYIDTQVSMDTVSMYRIIHSMSMVVLKDHSLMMSYPLDLVTSSVK